MAKILHFHQNRGPAPDRGPAPLWREMLGRSLRETREEQGDRLVDVARRAGISPQYLSEIERGRKEPSSEMIAAITGALGVDLADLLAGVAGDIRRFRGAVPAVHERHAGPAVGSGAGPAVVGRGAGQAVGRRPAGPVLLAA